ncbi:MAG: OmpA family protein, partial [Rhodothalassiaceae bacterium]
DTKLDRQVALKILPPEVGPFLVFFDFDSATLRADAAPILDDAAAAYERFGFVEVAVVGHTDRAGPDRYNQGLSERRAAAVKAALVARGVPAERIATSGRGESEPLVPTNDGVREPQNRRVEITFPAASGQH